MSFASLEKYIINLLYEGNVICKLEMIRYLSPILIERIVRALPIKGLVLVSKNKVLINIPIAYGLSKGKFNHEEGNVAYDAFNKALIIYLGSEADNLENIGRVSEGLSNLSKLKTGMFVTLDLEKEE